MPEKSWKGRTHDRSEWKACIGDWRIAGHRGGDRVSTGGARRRRSICLSAPRLVTRFDLQGGIFGGITGRVHAVEGVSFDIFPGETLALVGESGCGKSTVARSIMQLDRPVSGSIRYDGQEIIGVGRAKLAGFRREVQMVFQDPFSSLNPRMTIGQALKDPMRVHRIARGAALRQRAAGSGPAGQSASAARTPRTLPPCILGRPTAAYLYRQVIGARPSTAHRR